MNSRESLLRTVLLLLCPLVMGGCATINTNIAAQGPFGGHKSDANDLLPMALQPGSVATGAVHGSKRMGMASSQKGGDRPFSPLSEVSSEPANLWRHIRAGLVLPEPTPASILDEPMAIFLANPQRVHAMTKHARPFLHLIVEELERRHLPMELALLPAIESGYVGNARSPSAAAGIWQFIPATGRTYGLENDRWVDGRRDVTDSTAAALQYLQRLHTRFNGDWLLAIAAYNCGAKTVDDAMAANRAGGRPTDFWSLKGLPEQTRRYVPKLLAFAKIIKIPALYHQVLEPIPNRQYVTRVEVDGLVGIAHLAQASGLSEGEFRTLNPAFKKGALPPAGHPVLVPVQHVGVVKDMASRLPDKNSEEAARNLAEAEAADRPVKKDRIKTAGKEKRDPSAKDTLPLLDAAEETLRGSRGHRAHRRGYGSNGEGRGHARSAQAHLAENAPHDKNSPGANFRVSPEGVRRKDAPNKNAKKDQPLLTGVKTFLKPSEEQHRIRKGDTLLTIAKHYHIPVAAIQKENKLANTALREGNVLRIPHSDPRSNSGG